eukprot:TRINITY_DN3444_c0_g1_i1.p1 TRINITY_DN3444_c0_g1~~TRINITY_DN3444_c0_g1_i1.p1  ORF type:complete len:249 (-),score=19.62 TRINITY_DN3444_c0_g1_i1:216-962(-)
MDETFRSEEYKQSLTDICDDSAAKQYQLTRDDANLLLNVFGGSVPAVLAHIAQHGRVELDRYRADMNSVWQCLTSKAAVTSTKQTATVAAVHTGSCAPESVVIHRACGELQVRKSVLNSTHFCGKAPGCCSAVSSVPQCPEKCCYTNGISASAPHPQSPASYADIHKFLLKAALHKRLADAVQAREGSGKIGVHATAGATFVSGIGTREALVNAINRYLPPLDVAVVCQTTLVKNLQNEGLRFFITGS